MRSVEHIYLGWLKKKQFSLSNIIIFTIFSYMWQYGGNFIIYLTMNSRIREAYRLFLADILTCIRSEKKKKLEIDLEITISSE